ncbi:MAG: penicillin-binding protein 2 [Methylococcales bacterium]
MVYEDKKLDVAFAGRRQILLGMMVCIVVLLIGRAVDLQVLMSGSLQKASNSRSLRVVEVPAFRGEILDRNGIPLAVSVPVQSIWINPQKFQSSSSEEATIGKLLAIPQQRLSALLERSKGKSFVYLKRRINPDLAEQVANLGLEGLYFKQEYRRYYPKGEVASHLVGFTDIDDSGQEGLEGAFDSVLKGVPGGKRIIRDGRRRVIENVESLSAPTSGQNLTLSIDQRLQYLAYRELKSAVIQHRARSGALVLLDSRTGEVLAMVNQPSFNPNTRKGLKGFRYRNRVVTDLFEPGSTIKPFAVACALEEGKYRVDSIVDTTPGFFRVGRNIVRDTHDYGLLDVAQVIQKSSNVGATKIALSLEPNDMWKFYDSLGFGQSVGVGLPAEATGRLPDHHEWRPFDQAILSFGYGLSGSALQLARAYTVFANNGELSSISLFRRANDDNRQSVMSPETAIQIRQMLEQVITRDGTAYRASVADYRVAGKTGTVKKLGKNGYEKDRYLALFAGLAPASNPRLVMVVVIDEPSTGDYYGGVVAAPVFSKVMSSALRMLGVSPDGLETVRRTVKRKAGAA